MIFFTYQKFNYKRTAYKPTILTAFYELCSSKQLNNYFLIKKLKKIDGFLYGKAKYILSNKGIYNLKILNFKLEYNGVLITALPNRLITFFK